MPDTAATRTRRPAAKAAPAPESTPTPEPAAKMTVRCVPTEVLTLPMAQVAPHPLNPRGQDLGDLAELAASIAADGLFEPLVTITVAAYLAAEPDALVRPTEDVTHVIVMGHRRYAAAGLAGRTDVQVIVRDDLAPGAVAKMIAENLHREGLSPVAEAEGMAELARRGWPQRRIAEEVGCSQAHVSKRLALLKLPAEARGAVADGRMHAGDAVELGKLADVGDPVAGRIITEAVAGIERGETSSYVIAAAKRDLERAQTERKTREQLAKRGIEVVTGQQRDRLAWPRIPKTETKPHAAAGCLAAVIGWGGEAEYVCRNPASHPETLTPHQRREARAADDERESRKAAKARDAACAAVVAGPVPAAREQVWRFADALLGSGAGHTDSLRLAYRWAAAAGAVPGGLDHYRARDQARAAGDRAGLLRYAYAYALAADELRVRGTMGRYSGHEGWDDRHTGHLDRLIAAGYQPTPWEQDRLAEARAVAEARGTMSCGTCGCSGEGNDSSLAACREVFDRDAGQVVFACSEWSCQRHRATRKTAP
jgi:ParB/RepB/Spo0J family partition protein